MPSIFNDFFENEWLAKTGVTAPAINVIENDKDYKVEMAAPGMTKDDFKVNVDENNNLTYCMERKRREGERKTRVYSAANSHIPSSSRPSCCLKMWRRIRSTAKVEHGILSIEIPKMKEEEKQKTFKAIEV